MKLTKMSNKSKVLGDDAINNR